MAIRFVRKDFSDGAKEILTVVKVDGRDGYAVEVCSGPNVGDDFVGIYDLDGDKIEGNATWDAEIDVPASVVAEVEEGWAHGTTTVERMP